MPSRNRLLAWLGGVALVVGAVVALRATDDPVAPPDEPVQVPLPVRVNRYAAQNVVLPHPGQPPPQPTGLQASPGSGQLRLSWSDGDDRTGGDRTAGYDVSWRRPGQPPGVRRVIAPEVQLDGLTDGTSYQVEVRGVDEFGQRSAPAAVTATPGPAPEPWRAGLTGFYDDFADPRTVRADEVGSHWHLSGYRGCVDLAE
ncbi:fibronectin type III domain-containing protein, partial [Actinophytocola sp.]|uniref:fibronectin type III domain-containing protein n=1 Tax=Actinophytocola sp. TaxID=1872138 RepID=UPI002D7F7941